MYLPSDPCCEFALPSGVFVICGAGAEALIGANEGGAVDFLIVCYINNQKCILKYEIDQNNIP